MPAVKLKRLIALVPPDVHEAFLGVAERAGETGSGLLRRFMIATIERARRSEPIVLRLAPDASDARGG